MSSAIRTDFILSGEIMAIALATVADRPIMIQAGALIAVSFGITIAVYGVVGFIVKMDDIGVHLAARASRFMSAFGRGLVKSMPHLLKGLSVIGTAAMLWVGGGIIVHGLEHFGLNAVPHVIHDLFGARCARAGGWRSDRMVDIRGGRGGRGLAHRRRYRRCRTSGRKTQALSRRLESCPTRLFASLHATTREPR